MLKNFGKFKQWTGERLGAAKATLQTGDFQQLETDTENKRTGFEKVHDASEQVYGQLSKKKPSIEDAKTKCLPWESLASCWISHGSTFPDDDALGVALINLGQTEARIALLQQDFANTIKNEYIEVLKQGLQHYKEYDTLKKKLESRRLDYDAKLTRLQRSKKEKLEWGQETLAAKTKYDESESDVIQKMIALQEYEVDHCNALSQLMKSQLDYHQRIVELINELQDHMPNPEANRSLPSVTIPTTPITRSFANDSTHSLLVPMNDHYDSQNSFDEALPTPNTALEFNRHPAGSRKQSIDSIDRLRLCRMSSHSSASIHNNDDQLQHRQMSPFSKKKSPPPTMPRRRSGVVSNKNYRKAIFDFQGNSVDELSFCVGDVITVIEPVDQGWWMGEMEQNEPRHKGIFPINYTEETIVTASMTPPPPPRAMPSRPSHMAKSYNTQEEAQQVNVDYTQEQQDGSPFNDKSVYTSTSTAPGIILPSIGSAPAFRTNSTNVSSGKGTPLAPLTRSCLHTTDLTNRESTHLTSLSPPPPPLHTFSQFDIPALKTSSPLSSTTRTSPPPPPPPTQSRTKLVPIRSQKMEMNQVANCQDCGCDDYSVNLFKKGHCNNCFHKHPGI